MMGVPAIQPAIDNSHLADWGSTYSQPMNINNYTCIKYTTALIFVTGGFLWLEPLRESFHHTD